MKKAILKVVACVAIGAFGLVSTSCDEDSISTVIQIITNLVGQKGTTYQFTSSGEVQTLYKSGEQYLYDNERTAPVNAVIPVTINNTTAQIVIPQMTVGNKVFSEITISGLDLKGSSQYTSMPNDTILVGENVRADGTVTVNGETLSVSSLFIQDCHLTSKQLNLGLFQVFFGDNLNQVLSLSKVTGQAIENAQ